ncbi:DedA family protein [Methylocystis parvus]|uniref:DedA family protein n=1 Tax=Methylocystis parvus TaxID=134 RepID=A0A6B8M9R9_9HYPH|nr:DedA family protein [Methylocystis parvus]QGM98023.1 DedA family protein [Methylocystis parvus]WBK01661.1 DedA family protein [Methylocystis parvus OBBP]
MFDPAHLASLLQHYGYWAVGGVVMLESAGVPLPGETILVAASIYAGHSHALAIEGVVLAAAVGAILGDNAGYWLGRELGTPLLDRFGPRLGVTPEKIQIGQYFFRRWGGYVVFIGRFIALLRVLAAFLAGVNRLAPPTFFFFNAAGALVWSHLFGYGAYMLGAEIEKVKGPIGIAGLVIGAIGFIAGLRYYIANEEALIARAKEEMAKEPVV